MLAPLLTTLLVAAAPPTGSVCVVMPHAVVPGVDGETIAAAWSLRQRQDGIDVPLRAAHSRRSCAEPVQLVALVDRRARVVVGASAGGAGWNVDLGGVPASERGGELALALAAALDASSDVGPMVSIDDLDLPTPPPAWRVGVVAGGQLWSGDSTAAARLGPDLELRVAGLDERLSFGVRGGWLPTHDLAGAVPATGWAAHVEATAGWRLRLPARLGLRLSGGVGAEWRQLTARPASRLDTIEATSVAPAVSTEATLEWSASSQLFVSLSIGGRFYPAGERRTFLGGTVMDAPVAVGLGALRLGWWWN